MKVSDLFSAEEMRSLTRASDLRGWLAVGATWGMITLSFAAVAAAPGYWKIPAVLGALVILGGRHLALAILMHETAHYSLFSTRKLNDWVGLWLCGAPTFQDLRRYRPHHLRHHRWAGSPQDPDQDLVAAYPCSRASFRRKIFRDLSGQTGLKRLYGIWLMDRGKIAYTVSSRVEKLSPPAGGFLRNAGPPLLAQAALLGALWAAGHPELYLLWIGSYLTTFSAFLRIRSIAEHACTEMDLDPFRSTRTTLANPLARVTVAPHLVNFHLEHHLLMTAPYFQLPAIHRRLKERGALQGAFVARGYGEVLSKAMN